VGVPVCCHLDVFCILGFGLNGFGVGHVAVIAWSSGIVFVLKMRLANASGGWSELVIVATHRGAGLVRVGSLLGKLAILLVATVSSPFWVVVPGWASDIWWQMPYLAGRPTYLIGYTFLICRRCRLTL